MDIKNIKYPQYLEYSAELDMADERLLLNIQNKRIIKKYTV